MILQKGSSPHSVTEYTITLRLACKCQQTYIYNTLSHSDVKRLCSIFNSNWFSLMLVHTCVTEWVIMYHKGREGDGPSEYASNRGYNYVLLGKVVEGGDPFLRIQIPLVEFMYFV